MPYWKLQLIRLGRLVSHPRLWEFLLRRSVRYTITWAVTLIGTGIGLYLAWTAFDDPSRGDGNNGHIHIDFGGQYVMGRMIVQGYGRQLYNRDYQRLVVRQAYPVELGTPNAETPDADALMGSFMLAGKDRERPVHDRIAAFVSTIGNQDLVSVLTLAWLNQADVGGPLYPPVGAILNAPLATLEAQTAYRIVQVLNIILAFIAGWGLRLLSKGRIWWPVAAGLVMLYPGFNPSITLGQNATFTLAILIWGWVFIAGGRPGIGGAVWGLLVFKPVWALAFFVVPLLTRRWLTCATMIACGALLALSSVPFVGIHSWMDWGQVGEEAATTYKYDANWIPLSRDLLGLPRRFLDFDGHWTARRDDRATAIIGWTSIATVAALTFALTLRRSQQARATEGVPAAFILLGAWLCCFHFMYYDVLLSGLPVFLLFTYPQQHLRLRLLTISGWPWVINGMIPTLTAILVATPFVLYQMLGKGAFDVPVDTICLILIWLWCGWLWLRSPTDAHQGQSGNDTAKLV